MRNFKTGALGFGLGREPPAPLRQFNRTLDLSRLQALADAILADEDLPIGTDAEQAQELLLIGTSMGGARPKTVVEDDDGLWIAKFNRPDDPWNHARVERSMLILGRACGLSTAESKLASIGDRDVLLVKRFDRELSEQGYRRARMFSALTLLRAQESPQARDRWSYVLLSEELRRISSQPRADAAELFRRMTFNALISNIDDHPRNHAVIAMNRIGISLPRMTSCLQRQSAWNGATWPWNAAIGADTLTPKTCFPNASDSCWNGHKPKGSSTKWSRPS